MAQPNVLFLMCDQFRFDCIAALGNAKIATPNLDRLVRRGAAFTRAYSTCPVCVPARYTVRTGCEPYTTGCYSNDFGRRPGDADMPARTGQYLANAMRERGYYAFGIGKFHTTPNPFEDCGYDVQMNTEELWGSEEERMRDAYAGFMRREHPEFNHIQQLHGERTNMYYMPQLSPFPPELTVEGFAAARVVEQIEEIKNKPYFGFVSFVGPHPPCAPPVPYNLLYDPDGMDSPVLGERATDHMDEQIPWMNHIIWGDEINDFGARSLKSRYYAEITYIDDCVGKILDAVEARDDAANTLICFFSDHGDHLGDHHAWQKESYFEQSCHVPFLLSWPDRLAAGTRHDDIVALTDLFGIATAAAGAPEYRDGHPVLAALDGSAAPRDYLFACYGTPGTLLFKAMIRRGDLKYIYLSNGGLEQLFNLKEDPEELKNLDDPATKAEMKALLAAHCAKVGLKEVLDADGNLLAHEFKHLPLFRIRQFDLSSGVRDFTFKGSV